MASVFPRRLAPFTGTAPWLLVSFLMEKQCGREIFPPGGLLLVIYVGGLVGRAESIHNVQLLTSRISFF